MLEWDEIGLSLERYNGVSTVNFTLIPSKRLKYMSGNPRISFILTTSKKVGVVVGFDSSSIRYNTIDPTYEIDKISKELVREKILEMIKKNY